jgi:hypothetical protein
MLLILQVGPKQRKTRFSGLEGVHLQQVPFVLSPGI